MGDRRTRSDEVDCTDNQIQQIEVLLGYALNEIQFWCGQGDAAAASQLAYACHNLPGCHRTDFFGIDYFREWFHLFHEQNGKVLYNYLSMLSAVDGDRKITPEIALQELDELDPEKG